MEDVYKRQAKVKRLENDVYKLQLERDILEKAGDILKKEEGINLDQLTNREKAVSYTHLYGEVFKHYKSKRSDINKRVRKSL